MAIAIQLVELTYHLSSVAKSTDTTGSLDSGALMNARETAKMRVLEVIKNRGAIAKRPLQQLTSKYAATNELNSMLSEALFAKDIAIKDKYGISVLSVRSIGSDVFIWVGGSGVIPDNYNPNTELTELKEDNRTGLFDHVEANLTD